MKLFKKTGMVLLALVMLLTGLSITPGHPTVPEADASVLPTTTDPSNPNRHYFVALFWQPLSKKMDGTFVPHVPCKDGLGSTCEQMPGQAQPDDIGVMTFPYSFDETFNITNVSIQKFDEAFVATDRVKWEEIYHKSRYYQDSWTERSASTNQIHDVTMNNLTGIGTKHVEFNISLTPGSKAKAYIPEQKLVNGVMFSIYYFPVLITIDTEPTLYVKYFSPDGSGLGSVLGNYEQMMTTGQTYNISPATHPDYTYLGYKQSKDGATPSGSIIPGAPPGFTFDNTYRTHNLFFYYKKNTAGQINVRHMVRNTPGGIFSQKDTSSIEVPTLPATRSFSNGTGYGTPIGYSLSYSGYSNTVSNGTSTSVSLTNTQSTAYVTFFYENILSFNGDFEVTPSTIAYRNTFTIKPKEFTMNNCVYQSHQYRIERNGSTWTSELIYNQAMPSTFAYDQYPWVVGVGTHFVYMKINTSNCGSSSWIGPQTLTVTSPGTNNPPEFMVGFVRPGEPTRPVHQVVQGEVLNLIYIDDPTVPTPLDPDGDDMSFDGFNLSSGSSFIRSLASRGTMMGNGIHGITMSEIGYHSVTGQMRDHWGATSTASTYIEVVPVNPVAVAACPLPVVSGRTVDQSKFDASGSYSPVAGRTIDHTRNEWINKQTVYINDTDEEMIVTVSLYVYDNYGARSLQPATCQMIVKPDLPPVAKLQLPPISVRNVPIDILNKSYSPDGDQLISAEYRYKYDSNNNGFKDERFQSLGGNLTKTSFIPDKIGKYLFNVKITEASGKTGETSESDLMLILDVINDAPTVSFVMRGDNPQPDIDPPLRITPAKMLKDWALTDNHETTAVPYRQKLWSVVDNRLVAGSGATFHSQSQKYSRYEDQANQVTMGITRFADHGYGTNDMSPWRAAVNTQSNGGIVHPDYQYGKLDTYFLMSPYYNYDGIRFVANKKYIYFNFGHRIFAMNKDKVGTDEPYDWVYAGPAGTYYNATIIADRTIYAFDRGNSLRMIDAFTGELIKYVPNDYMNEATMDKLPRPTTAAAANDDLIGINQRNTQLVRVDRDFNVIKSAALPSPVRPVYLSSSCYASHNYSNLFQGNEGDYYFYSYWSYDEDSNCRHNDAKLYKIDADLNIQWVYSFPTYGAPVKMYLQSSYPQGWREYYEPQLIVNPIKRQLIVRDMTNYKLYTLNYTTGSLVSTANLSTQYGDYNNYGYNGVLGWTGNVTRPPMLGRDAFEGGVQTIDGWYTPYAVHNAAVYNGINGTQQHGFNRMPTASYGGWYSSAGYFGDGIYITSFLMSMWAGQTNYYQAFSIHKGTPTTTPATAPIKPFQLGQFISPDQAKDVEFAYDFSIAYEDLDQDLFGLTVRAVNAKYRYAVESDGEKVYITRYHLGARTVLAEQPYKLTADTIYKMRVKTAGDEIQVWLNNVPIVTATGIDREEGYFGYYTEKAFVTFGELTIKPITGTNGQWSNQYAIWEDGTAMVEIQYEDITFSDPENDPPLNGTFDWSVEHTVKFINNQGLSPLHDQTFQHAQLAIDKVGEYEVILSARDDPHPEYLYPSNVFDIYRKSSNKFKQKIIVHRRPIADFTVSQAADGTVKWTDKSYDPDRYESATHYDTEATGIDYLETKGITEKRFYYITPAGLYVPEKLVAPTGLGRYEIGLIVKDEYGAWSNWAIEHLDIGLIASPNTPPIPGFTTSAMTTYRGVAVTMNSTASDKEDGSRENIKHDYYIRNLTTAGAESYQSNSRTTWQKTFSTLGTFNIRQVVEDSKGAIAQVNKQITIINRLPTANVLTPSSMSIGNPTKMTTKLPTFEWTYADEDGDSQREYQVRVYNNSTNALLLDSGERGGVSISWMANYELPEQVTLRVQIRVNDGYDWGNWSAAKYFIIEANRAPSGNFTWRPDPVYEGDTITIVPSVYDPDGDELKLDYTIVSPSGQLLKYQSVARSPYSGLQGPIFNTPEPGRWQVTMTVSDLKSPSVAISKAIQVRELHVFGEVLHTEEWERNRLQYNERNDPDRPSHLFWAGEAFVLRARTTDTGSSVTKASAVSVRAFDHVDKMLAAQNRAYTDWAAILRSADTSISFETLEDGVYTFVFAATYTNGVIKYAHVSVEISGNVHQYVKVHRIS